METRDETTPEGRAAIAWLNSEYSLPGDEKITSYAQVRDSKRMTDEYLAFLAGYDAAMQQLEAIKEEYFSAGQTYIVAHPISSVECRIDTLPITNYEKSVVGTHKEGK